MFFVTLFYTVLYIWLGVALIKYRKQVHDWTWDSAFINKYLWRWWTYLVMILLWLFFIFVWVLQPFGWLDLLKNDEMWETNILGDK